MTIVLVATFNGILMHLFLFPYLETCTRQGWDLLSDEVLRYTPYAVSAGAVSAVSWYTALVLGIWRTLTLSYWQIIGTYSALIILGILTANLFLFIMLRILGVTWPTDNKTIMEQRIANYLQ
jgi:hypothetical protein